MTLRREINDAIRALNGNAASLAPVIRLLRNPAPLHMEIRALLIELLQTDSENPLRLRVYGNGPGRLPKGRNPDETRLRWLKELIRPDSLSRSTAREIADAMEPGTTRSRYRVELGQRTEGNILPPEDRMKSIIIGCATQTYYRAIKSARPHVHGLWTQCIRRMAERYGISEAMVHYHLNHYDATLKIPRQKLARLILLKK